LSSLPLDTGSPLVAATGDDQLNQLPQATGARTLAGELGPYSISETIRFPPPLGAGPVPSMVKSLPFTMTVFATRKPL
jgi:hypothetical protein